MEAHTDNGAQLYLVNTGWGGRGGKEHDSADTPLLQLKRSAQLGPGARSSLPRHVNLISPFPPHAYLWAF